MENSEIESGVNTYAKYCPNVFVAKCPEQHSKGEDIIVNTKYGQEHDCIVYNLVYTKDGYYYYSIVRADGFNFQERAKAKAERLSSWAAGAEKKSDQYYEASNEGKEFLRLAEPIKIGHHSEKRHRALIERNRVRMDRSMEFNKKAEGYISRIDYWESKSKEINLSMPESLEYYEFRLEQSKEKQKGLTDGTIKREHSYSLAYATKEVKELEEKVKDAKRLWGE